MPGLIFSLLERTGMDQNLVTTQDLAKLLDISGATVNYYTNLGLLRIKDRKGNVRLYDKNSSKKLYDQIREMRRQGYPLRIIQERLQKGYSI